MLLNSFFTLLTTEPDYSTWRRATVKVSTSLAQYGGTLLSAYFAAFSQPPAGNIGDPSPRDGQGRGEVIPVT
jgi:hypothetical protein